MARVLLRHTNATVNVPPGHTAIVARPGYVVAVQADGQQWVIAGQEPGPLFVDLGRAVGTAGLFVLAFDIPPSVVIGDVLAVNVTQMTVTAVDGNQVTLSTPLPADVDCIVLRFPREA